jgi:signal transduction histidine kinase
MLIIHDITRIKQLEVKETKRKMLFFSSVAHEVKTPLNSIIPMSNLLKKYITNENGLRILKLVINSSLHL